MLNPAEVDILAGLKQAGVLFLAWSGLTPTLLSLYHGICFREDTLGLGLTPTPGGHPPIFSKENEGRRCINIPVMDVTSVMSWSHGGAVMVEGAHLFTGVCSLQTLFTWVGMVPCCLFSGGRW